MNVATYSFSPEIGNCLWNSFSYHDVVWQRRAEKQNLSKNKNEFLKRKIFCQLLEALSLKTEIK